MKDDKRTSSLLENSLSVTDLVTENLCDFIITNHFIVLKSCWTNSSSLRSLACSIHTHFNFDCVGNVSNYFDWNIDNCFDFDFIGLFINAIAHQWLVGWITRIPIPSRIFINNNISTHQDLLIDLMKVVSG